MKTLKKIKNTLLIIDDDQLLCDAIFQQFSSQVEVLMAHTGADSISICSTRKIDVVLLDQKLPDGKGVDLCQSILAYNEQTKIIFITAFPSLENAISAIKLGAFDYLSKPFAIEELELAIEKSLRTLELERVEQVQVYQQNKESGQTVLVGKNHGLSEVWRMIRLAGSTNSPILITGETGVGKNIVAKAIHYEGKLRKTSFIDINCASLPETLIEAELFGFEKGAFTGAVSAKKGIFEMAEGGTLFLDEIGDLPFNLQAKLLSVLDDKKVRRIGSESVKHVDFRLITATNKNIEEAIKIPTFREDLFFRLSVIRIHIPPLREHITDVPALCDYFIRKICGSAKLTISDFEIQLLMLYNWPGNIRELKNIIERSIILRKDSIIQPSQLMSSKPDQYISNAKNHNELPDISTLAEIEKNHIRHAFEKLKRNYTQTAKALNIARSTLKRKMKSMDIN